MIIQLQEVDSTNTYLRQIVTTQNLLEGDVVCSDFQTGGRGQKGNTWQSNAAENLLFSILLQPDFVEAKEQFIISQIVSVAIKNVLDKYTDGISVKWPNDIYRYDQKICGILIENDLCESRIMQSIIGIGLNVNQEFFDVEKAPKAVSLRQVTGRMFDRGIILTEILEELKHLYDIAKNNNVVIINKYKDSLYRKHGYHKYQLADGVVFNARIIDVELMGNLILETESGEMRRFAFKEVIFL